MSPPDPSLNSQPPQPSDLLKLLTVPLPLDQSVAKEQKRGPGITGSTTTVEAHDSWKPRQTIELICIALVGAVDGVKTAIAAKNLKGFRIAQIRDGAGRIVNIVYSESRDVLLEYAGVRPGPYKLNNAKVTNFKRFGGLPLDETGSAVAKSVKGSIFWFVGAEVIGVAWDVIRAEKLDQKFYVHEVVEITFDLVGFAVSTTAGLGAAAIYGWWAGNAVVPVVGGVIGLAVALVVGLIWTFLVPQSIKDKIADFIDSYVTAARQAIDQGFQDFFTAPPGTLSIEEGYKAINEAFGAH